MEGKNIRVEKLVDREIYYEDMGNGNTYISLYKENEDHNNIYIQLNRKTKRKKAMKNKEKLPSHCLHCGDLINYLNHKHHLYMYCTEEKSKTLLDGIEKKKNISKNTWYNFKDKHPPNDAEILVYGNKLEKYAVEYVDSEFETRKNNLNYFQWMLLRNKKTIYDKGR